MSIVAPGGTTTVHLVPHTHWDREWYEPFQVFRMRLVDLVDDVLARMETEPGFRFTLDGQLATVDDYLEFRPGSEERIRRFVREGRLAIGPRRQARLRPAQLPPLRRGIRDGGEEHRRGEFEVGRQVPTDGHVAAADEADAERFAPHGLNARINTDASVGLRPRDRKIRVCRQGLPA